MGHRFKRIEVKQIEVLTEGKGGTCIEEVLGLILSLTTDMLLRDCQMRIKSSEQ